MLKSFGKGGGPHAQRHDAPGARVGGAGLRPRRAREDEPAGAEVLVDGAPHDVPRRGVSLPLVDQDRRFALGQEPRAGLHLGEGVGIVQRVRRVGVPAGRPGLADGPRPLDADRGQRVEQLAQLLLHDSRLVLEHSGDLPAAALLDYCATTILLILI